MSTDSPALCFLFVLRCFSGQRVRLVLQSIVIQGSQISSKEVLETFLLRGKNTRHDVSRAIGEHAAPEALW